MFLSKNRAVQAFRAATAISKRAIPTLDSILKFSALITWATPAVTAAESESTIAQASAEKILATLSTNDVQEGQEVIKDVAGFNKLLMDLMEKDSDLSDPGIRITKADLPRLPEWSDDEKKIEKYNAARMDLANLIAALGPLFDPGTPKTDA